MQLPPAAARAGKALLPAACGSSRLAGSHYSWAQQVALCIVRQQLWRQVCRRRGVPIARAPSGQGGAQRLPSVLPAARGLAPAPPDAANVPDAAGGGFRWGNQQELAHVEGLHHHTARMLMSQHAVHARLSSAPAAPPAMQLYNVGRARCLVQAVHLQQGGTSLRDCVEEGALQVEAANVTYELLRCAFCKAPGRPAGAQHLALKLPPPCLLPASHILRDESEACTVAIPCHAALQRCNGVVCASRLAGRHNFPPPAVELPH